MSVISLLQLATRAGIPRQSEIRSNYQVASSFLRSLLILVTPILSTDGTSERCISDQDQEYSLLIRKRRHHTNKLGSIDPDVKGSRNNAFIRCVAHWLTISALERGSAATRCGSGFA